jgi:peptidoglycan/xylan/chitin deacetylase (PgdA/CDA1 family)
MGRRDSVASGCFRRELIAVVGTIGLSAVAGCLDTFDDPGRENASGPGTSSTNGTEEPTVRRVGLDADTFERLADLKVISGRLSADTERHTTGTQCAALETGADGAWLRIPLSEPMDFTNARVACDVATDGPAAGDYLYLDLRDVNGNRFRTRTTVRGHRRLVRVDFGVVNPRVDGPAVDLGKVNRLSFRPGPRKGSGSETVYLDNPCRIEAPDTPKVVFQFDDGNESDYTRALPYLSQYDYPAITYVNTENVGNDGRLDEGLLQELKAEGWLVGSHTTDHTDLTEPSDEAEIERRVRDAKQWLIERGFTDGARHFAYPYNAVDERALSIVSRFHDTGRVWDWNPVALPTNLQLIPGEGEVRLSKMRTLLDWATRYGGVVVLYYHNLESEDAFEEFRAVVDEVRRRDRAGEVDVVRLDELEDVTRKIT